MDFLIDFLLHVDQHLMEFMQAYHQWTYVLLFLIVFCETGLVVLPFLPGDSLLFVSGAMASLPGTPLHISLLLLVLFAAAVLGDSCNYLLGQHFGEKLFNRPDSRLFRQSHLEECTIPVSWATMWREQPYGSFCAAFPVISSETCPLYRSISTCCYMVSCWYRSVRHSLNSYA